MLSLQEAWSEVEAFRKGERRQFLISLSGGPDSVFLFHELLQWRENQNIELYAFHFNFGLRGKDSRKDEAFCRKLARRHQVPLFVAFSKRSKQNFSQAAGREERLSALRGILPHAELFEAHHRDDQLETFFFRLMRGSGLRGLQSMSLQSQRDQRVLWRPLLGLKKSEILGSLDERGLSYRQDRSNETSAYERNWIRRRLLPKMEKRFPALQRSIERLQEQMTELEDFLESLTASPEEVENWNLQNWKALPKPLRQRVASRLLERELRCSLSHERWQEFHVWIEDEAANRFNLPKDWHWEKRKLGNRLILSFRKPVDVAEKKVTLLPSLAKNERKSKPLTPRSRYSAEDASGIIRK